MILSFYRKINDQQKPSHMVGGAGQSNKIITIKRATQLVFFFSSKINYFGSFRVYTVIQVANNSSLSWVKVSLPPGLIQVPKVAKPTFLILILINRCCNY